MHYHKVCLISLPIYLIITKNSFVVSLFLSNWCNSLGCPENLDLCEWIFSVCSILLFILSKKKNIPSYKFMFVKFPNIYKIEDFHLTTFELIRVIVFVNKRNSPKKIYLVISMINCQSVSHTIIQI